MDALLRSATVERATGTAGRAAFVHVKHEPAPDNASSSHTAAHSHGLVARSPPPRHSSSSHRRKHATTVKVEEMLPPLTPPPPPSSSRTTAATAAAAASNTALLFQAVATSEAAASDARALVPFNAAATTVADEDIDENHQQQQQHYQLEASQSFGEYESGEAAVAAEERMAAAIRERLDRERARAEGYEPADVMTPPPPSAASAARGSSQSRRRSGASSGGGSGGEKVMRKRVRRRIEEQEEFFCSSSSGGDDDGDADSGGHGHESQASEAGADEEDDSEAAAAAREQRQRKSAMLHAAIAAAAAAGSGESGGSAPAAAAPAAAAAPPAVGVNGARSGGGGSAASALMAALARSGALGDVESMRAHVTHPFWVELFQTYGEPDPPSRCFGCKFADLRAQALPYDSYRALIDELHTVIKEIGIHGAIVWADAQWKENVIGPIAHMLSAEQLALYAWNGISFVWHCCDHSYIEQFRQVRAVMEAQHIRDRVSMRHTYSALPFENGMRDSTVQKEDLDRLARAEANLQRVKNADPRKSCMYHPQLTVDASQARPYIRWGRYSGRGIVHLQQ